MSTDRELLAAALHAIGQEDGSGRDCSICISDADALLPVVDRIANERAAAELRAAAESSTYWVLTHESVYTCLTEHADALDPT